MNCTTSTNTTEHTTIVTAPMITVRRGVVPTKCGRS